MQQYQSEYDKVVLEYLEEAEYSLKAETENLTVAELHADILLYVQIVGNLKPGKVSSIKVARSLHRYDNIVTRVLTPTDSE